MSILQPNRKINLKNKSQYQVYEEGLSNYSNYKQKSKSKLEEWNLITSQVLSPLLMNKNKKQSIEASEIESRHSPINNLYIQSKAGKYSRISQQKPKSETYIKYSDRIILDYEIVDDNEKSVADLQRQIKSMRQMFIQLNSLVTQKLNKYEMTVLQPKKLIEEQEGEKGEEILRAKIQNNKKTLQILEKEIKQADLKNRAFEEKDHLMSLQTETIQIQREIKQKKKQKYDQSVVVSRLDNKLLQIRREMEQKQFHIIKIIKHNMLHFEKKFEINSNILKDLEKTYFQLSQKDEKLKEKYEKSSKFAEDHNLLVKANKNYISNKKLQDQLQAQVELVKKNLDVTKKSKAVETEKIQRHIAKMAKQNSQISSRIEQLQIINTNLTKKIDQIIEKNKLTNKLLNKISYKFGEPFKDSLMDTNQVLQQENFEKVVMKSRLKILLNENLLEHSPHSPQLSSQRYQSLNVEKQKNDKNNNTIELDRSREFRIKPSLNIKRKDNKSVMENSMDQKKVKESEEKQHQSSLNYKPKRFQKILSSRKDKIDF